MKRRGSEWSSLYLLIAVAIAAVLLVTFVKPLFKQAQETSSDATDAAAKVASGALFGISLAGIGKAKRFSKSGFSLSSLGFFKFGKPLKGS